MKNIVLTGKNGETFNIDGECLASVEALNHDDTVRSAMRMFKTKDGYVCESVTNPNTIDARHRIEQCEDALGVYEFFGTEPLANYLYGTANLTVPGFVQKNE